MNKTILSLACVASFAAAPAMAQTAGHYYGSIHGEAVVSSSSDLEASASAVSASATADYDAGAGIGAAIGYQIDDSLRVEGELAYRHTEVDTINIGGTVVDGNDLNLDVIAAMANLYYSYPMGQFSPYVGAGLGVAYNDESDEADTAFAYQGMVGVEYKLTQNGTVFGGYRYFGTTDFEDTTIDPVVGRVDSSINVSQHILEAGYRFAF